jgi:hypothetical protein
VNNNPANSTSNLRLIIAPALISLALTLLRLLGELQHWPGKWFSTETGGILPSGFTWLIGISWLPIPFGVYFAVKLAAIGQKPSGTAKAVAYPILGLLITLGGLFGVTSRIPVRFPYILIVIWLVMAIAAVLQFPGWSALAKVLLTYGLAARVPVVVVMFLAMRGNWGTHYDYVGITLPSQMDFWPRFLWLAFFPQMVFWVGFTILIGSLFGGLAYVAWGRLKHSP